MTVPSSLTLAIAELSLLHEIGTPSSAPPLLSETRAVRCRVSPIAVAVSAPGVTPTHATSNRALVAALAMDESLSSPRDWAKLRMDTTAAPAEQVATMTLISRNAFLSIARVSGGMSQRRPSGLCRYSPLRIRLSLERRLTVRRVTRSSLPAQ